MVSVVATGTACTGLQSGGPEPGLCALCPTERNAHGRWALGAAADVATAGGQRGAYEQRNRTWARGEGDPLMGAASWLWVGRAWISQRGTWCLHSSRSRPCIFKHCRPCRGAPMGNGPSSQLVSYGGKTLDTRIESGLGVPFVTIPCYTHRQANNRIDFRLVFSAVDLFFPSVSMLSRERQMTTTSSTTRPATTSCRCPRRVSVSGIGSLLVPITSHFDLKVVDITITSLWK